MREILFIDDTIANRISYYLLLAFLAFLPFERFYSEIVLIYFCVHTIIQIKLKNIQAINKSTWIVSSLFLINLASALYSQHKDKAFDDIGRQLAILLFPLLFSMTGLDLSKYKMNFLKVFGFICSATIAYLFIDSFYLLWYGHLPVTSIFKTAFINQNFSQPIGMHATYLSMYTCLSIGIFIYLIFHEKSKWTNFFYLILLAFLVAGLIELSSKSVFIATLIIINFLIPLFLLKKNKLRTLVISSLMTITVVFLISRIGSFEDRYVAQLKGDLTQADINNEILEPRIARWKAALTLIRQSPLIGYGSGEEIIRLKEVYFERKLYNSYLLDLNAHNQYLSLVLKTGIVGLIIYLYVLYFGFSRAFREKDFLFGCFLILIATVSFSENILDTNKGIFFFSFFFSLFLFRKKEKPARSDAFIVSI
ncbi:MAG TPA: O-antigen ligase family protein [Puia sp.]|nr:O-antigen ligase family protein [Puia sp.]